MAHNDSKIQGGANKLKNGVGNVTRHAAASPFMEGLERLGYVVRGVVYGIIGLLALQVVLGGGSKLTDTQGAIGALGSTPLGHLLLYVILAGLVGYGLWGLIRAIVDPQHNGTDAKGIGQRLGFAVSGISYLALAFATFNLIRGTSVAQNGAQTTQLQQTAGTILSKPWGVWVLGLVALVMIGVGLLQVYQGLRRDFDQQFKPYSLTSNQRKWISRLGRFGAVARGLVFTLIGVFLFLSAYHKDASLAKGIDGVLASILHQPFGPWLLGIVALGLIAFGIYSALSGLWLRLKR